MTYELIKNSDFRYRAWDSIEAQWETTNEQQMRGSYSMTDCITRRNLT